MLISFQYCLRRTPRKLFKGPSREDVPGQGGWWVSAQKEPTNLHSNNCVIMGVQGGTRERNPEFYGTSFMDGP